jgi:MFS family permease
MVAGVLVFTANLEMYMLLRIVQGMCAGIYSALVPLIIKELAPFELSGVFGVFPQLFITVGIFVSCFLSFVLSQIYDDPTGSSYWRFIFAFSLVTLVIQTFALKFIFPFETPKYLIENNDESKARQLISYIYRPEFVDEVFK